MATFLELCAKLAQNTAATGPAPATVVGQTGRKGQVVGFVRDAWTAIQNMSPYWSWLRAEFEGDLVVNQLIYQPADLGIATRFSEWIEDDPARDVPAMSLYDNSIGRDDEAWIREISYDAWRMRFDYRTHDAQRPTYWAIYPGDNSLRFGSRPDKAYKVRGEYRKTPQVLAADTDVPEMPDRFHDLIWQKAAMKLAGSDEAVQAYQFSKADHDETMAALLRDCLPKFSTGAAGPIDR